MTDAALDLLAREAALRERTGSLRMRDAAAALGVPEAALIEARRRSGAAVRLARPEAPEGFGRVLARLPEAGEVMALTRNETAVHEKVGRFAPPDLDGALGQVVGDIDLRLFLQHWRFGYAVSEAAAAQPAVLRCRRHRNPQGLPPRGDRRRRLRADRRRFRRSRRRAGRFDPPRRRGPSGRMPRSTSPACATPGAASGRPTCSSPCCGSSASPAPGDAARRPGVRPPGAGLGCPRRCSRPRPPLACRSWSSSEPRLPADPRRADPPRQGRRALAERPRPRVQPAPARGPGRGGLGRAQAVGARRHPRARALRRQRRLAAQLFGHRPAQGQERDDWRALVTGLPGL